MLTLTEEERKELEELKKDPDVKLARKRDPQRQYLFHLRSLKKKGQKIRTALEEEKC